MTTPTPTPPRARPAGDPETVYDVFDQPCRVRNTSVRRSAPRGGSSSPPSTPDRPGRCAVAGPVDIATAGLFADRFGIAGRGGVHPLVVDLSEVDVLAGAGGSVLFAARSGHVAHGTAFTVVTGADCAVAQVLTPVGPDLTSLPLG